MLLKRVYSYFVVAQLNGAMYNDRKLIVELSNLAPKPSMEKFEYNNQPPR